MTEWKRRKGSAPEGEGPGVTIGSNRGGGTGGTGGSAPIPGLTRGATDTAPSPGWTKGTGQQGPGQMTIGGSRAKPEWTKGVAQQGPSRVSTTVRDPVKRFEQLIVDDTSPADGVEAQARVDELIQFLETLIPANRRKIAESKPLMAKARTWVGNHQYMALAAAAGVFASKPGDGTKGTSPTDVNHMTGGEADTFIQTAMGAVPHLKTYLEAAVAAGRKGDGFIAILDEDDWNAVYPEEFPSEPIGSKDEQDTNAFVSNVKRGPAIIKKDRGTRSTAIHESMHRYAEDDVNTTWGFDLNEGITEYFTRLITDRDGEPAAKGGPERDNYNANVKFVRTSLVKVLGSSTKSREIALAEIYFKGDTELLKKKVLALLKKQGYDKTQSADIWDDLDDALSKGDWTTAARLLK